MGEVVDQIIEIVRFCHRCRFYDSQRTADHREQRAVGGERDSEFLTGVFTSPLSTISLKR